MLLPLDKLGENEIQPNFNLILEVFSNPKDWEEFKFKEGNANAKINLCLLQNSQGLCSVPKTHELSLWLSLYGASRPVQQHHKTGISALQLLRAWEKYP